MSNSELKKLQVLVTVVPNEKKEVVLDLLEDFEVNFSISFHGSGTVNNTIGDVFGLNNYNREIIFSIIRKDRSKDAILSLEDKFKKFKMNQSMAFSIPLESMIGMQNYLFLSNQGGEYLGK